VCSSDLYRVPESAVADALNRPIADVG
jgi:hypothetical protein